jgi:hypothetical protein
MIDEGRSRQLVRHPLHPDVYGVNETTRRINSFKAGIEFARDHFAPKLTETAATRISVTEYREALPRYNDVGIVVSIIRKLKATGVRFKEEP